MRILQEAMTNISRHANATYVEVNLSVDPAKKLIMNIRDNGVGIKKINSRTDQGLGILGMHERAKTIGGVVSVSAADRGGTLVNVVVPLTNGMKINHD